MRHFWILYNCVNSDSKTFLHSIIDCSVSKTLWHSVVTTRLLGVPDFVHDPLSALSMLRRATFNVVDSWQTGFSLHVFARLKHERSRCVEKTGGSAAPENSPPCIYMGG